MQTKQRPRVQIKTPGELIAAVPHLLGFVPEESLVICSHRSPLTGELGICVRTDIPPPKDYRALAEQLSVPILRSNAATVTVVIVSQDEGRPPDKLPATGQVEALVGVFAGCGVLVDHSLWTPKITADSPWWCYDAMECSGTVPDPRATELAAMTVAHGATTYRSREEMRATLEPGNSRMLAARSERIAMALRQQPDPAYAQRLVEAVIADIREGQGGLDEDRIVDLTVALVHEEVRDSCLRPEVIELGQAVQDLWLDLTRATPVPYRAEAAGLLAATAFLHGNGPLAGVAIDAALDANRGHRLSKMLRCAMDLGLSPEGFADIVARGLVGVDNPFGPNTNPRRY
ncbi:DUF4192 domain-containing protein [Actinocrispum sp. NPDC049592]|uniref:DUF4192 domain-containing protein n=1 Tax=Actinocrispum sp. NPDC049592 TaxID=3154835 RepID=UPI00342029EF